MKKYILTLILLISIIILCCACGSNTDEEIIGYWMRKDGYTISFVDDNICSLGEGSPQTYKIYDRNHLQIVDSSESGVTEFVFEIDGDTLKIRLAIEDGYTEFTKNADEQKKILEEIRELEAIAREEEREQEQIDSIQSKINSYWDDIADIQRDIDWNKSAIENNKADIVKWEENIEQEYIQCQEAIDFGDDKEYHENQRDEFIASYNEAIQGCNERIAELEAENVSYQKSIDLILIEIEKLEKEIKKLEKTEEGSLS